MEFIKELKKTGYDDIGNRNPLIVSNGVELSIQASRVHYATPRKDVNLEDYTHMELAIFTKCYSFADIRKVTSVLNLVNRFTSYYDGAVFSYVPVNLIESLYQELK